MNEQPDFHQLFKYRPNAYHHVTFPTKRRRPVLAGEVRQRVLYWFDEIARQHDFQLLEHNTWLDHAHLLIFAHRRRPECCDAPTEGRIGAAHLSGV